MCSSNSKQGQQRAAVAAASNSGGSIFSLFFHGGGAAINCTKAAGYHHFPSLSFFYTSLTTMTTDGAHFFCLDHTHTAGGGGRKDSFVRFVGPRGPKWTTAVGGRDGASRTKRGEREQETGEATAFPPSLVFFLLFSPLAPDHVHTCMDTQVCGNVSFLDIIVSSWGFGRFCCWGAEGNKGGGKKSKKDQTKEGPSCLLSAHTGNKKKQRKQGDSPSIACCFFSVVWLLAFLLLVFFSG